LFLILLLSANGVAFGYPEGVKPLVAIVIPFLINSAAFSAVVIFFLSSISFILSSITLLTSS
jgi:hypothetical protein